MKRKYVLAAGGVALAAAALVGIGVTSYVQSLIAPKPLSLSFDTGLTERPAGSSCAGGNEDSPGVAKEILNLASDDIYVAGGTNPMPDGVWTGFSVSLPWLKNSTRHLLFDGSCFFRSPDAAADCSGEACFTVEEHFDYTWLKLTTVVGDDCYPDASGCSGDTVKAGYVSITTIAKCHEIIYEGTIYELSDGKGNRYVMHATANGTPDVVKVALPDGWRLEERQLDAPLVLLPSGNGDGCYYNIVRDNLVQSYHQYQFAEGVYPPAA